MTAGKTIHKAPHTRTHTHRRARGTGTTVNYLSSPSDLRGECATRDSFQTFPTRTIKRYAKQNVHSHTHKHGQQRAVASAHTAAAKKTIDATFLPHTQGRQVYRNRWLHAGSTLSTNTFCFATLFLSHFFLSQSHTPPDQTCILCFVAKLSHPELTLRERTFSSVGYG